MHTHIKSLIRTAALIGIVVPPTALAALALQLPADAIVGLGFDLLVSGADRNQTIVLEMETPDGETVGLRGRADESGEASLPVAGSHTERAGLYNFASNDGGRADIDVLPDAIDPVLSTIDVWTPRIDDDGDDAASVTVTLMDQYGNPLPGRIVTLVSGRGDDEVSAETNDTDASGEQHFSVRSYEPGTITLRAIDLLSGIPLEDSATIRSGSDSIGGHDDSETISRVSGGNRFFYAQVAGFDVLDAFDIEAPAELPIGEEASSITVRAVDRDGNTVEDYVGTVVFSSTDPSATLPNFGKYTFKERDLGEKSFPLVLKFKQPGEQTFRVEDQNDRTIFGDAAIEVGGTNGSAGGTIVITSPQDGAMVNGQSVTVQGVGPAFSNLIVLGGASDTPGSTDANGHFSIIIPLRADQRDYTIRVQGEDARYDSGPILLHLDADAPQIDTVTFNPGAPEEGDKVLVVVKGEVGLRSMTLTITQRMTNAIQSVTLNPSATSSGTYQGFFTAPQPDEYEPRLQASDAAGNLVEMITHLRVGSPVPDTVENVFAEPLANAVSVRWQSVANEEVDGYRVYVGEQDGQFGYSLDTDIVTDRATVAGLQPGKTYYFAVTALAGTAESNKSVSVSATVAGMVMVATPESEGLALEWSALGSETQISHYLLEYGLEGTALSEKRLLNRELTQYSLRDLINDVPYDLRLTPVTITGKALTELAATAKGTPSGTGFHPSAGDELPFDVTLHPGALPENPPTTPGTGLPEVLGLCMIAAAIGGGYYHLRRKAERTRTARFLASLPH